MQLTSDWTGTDDATFFWHYVAIDASHRDEIHFPVAFLVKNMEAHDTFFRKEFPPVREETNRTVYRGQEILDQRSGLTDVNSFILQIGQSDFGL